MVVKPKLSPKMSKNSLRAYINRQGPKTTTNSMLKSDTGAGQNKVKKTVQLNIADLGVCIE